jgi:hypothetical protein
LEDRLAEYRKRIEELFRSHPDHELFGSLPGAGSKLAPRLLAEIGDDRERFEGDAQNLLRSEFDLPVIRVYLRSSMFIRVLIRHAFPQPSS